MYRGVHRNTDVDESIVDDQIRDLFLITNVRLSD
jgi:hypothetical protein